jgi:uncharacterized membrane protein YozB (DUF420 family)
VDLSFLPTVNASLNTAATVLLISGLVFIRNKRVDSHRRSMIAAFAISCLFLALYVVHKVWRGFEHTSFHGEGVAKLAYLVILFSHLALAMAVPVLAVAMIYLGLRRRLDAHRRLAKLAWPVWIYVSVTGVVIYVMLYPMNPSAH